MTEHGATRYNSGCRCDVCREANRARVAAWKAANPERALAQRQRKRARERADGTRARQKREAALVRQLLSGPPGRRIGHKVFYHPADVDRWLANVELYKRDGIAAVIAQLGTASPWADATTHPLAPSSNWTGDPE